MYLLCMIMFIFYRYVALSKATTGTRRKNLIFFKLFLDLLCV